MWKIITAFIVFAVLSLFVIVQGADQLDMGGEKHGGETLSVKEAEKTAGAAGGAR